MAQDMLCPGGHNEEGGAGLSPHVFHLLAIQLAHLGALLGLGPTELSQGLGHTVGVRGGISSVRDELLALGVRDELLAPDVPPDVPLLHGPDPLRGDGLVPF